ncbi:SDR family NAD(P)-dependent oxidoreductase [Leisingera sp. HS039]|uniref:SDR family NAD(P)-dependent oxidoreductase n=1 Tax=unclassified Leisingera TaxID=2614906 RepID=UPI00107137A6|nr:SDR family NAD(P)-dependent oxidoreductase [Leisingera sp. NJS201]MBQ4824596.1 SDR family NAD(P)-dependent oxidoreductase [Leisingera sp. HS039]QBR36582.1 SDR family NAD(P)-dependent oxidoreductase [Leisingera sp. NJS201]
MTDFAGKTCWLVGASHGLGREVARQLDRAGARLVLSARSADALEDLARELTHARAVPVDVTDMDSVAEAFRQAGPVDALICNAGAYEPMRTQDWDADAVLAMNDVNFTGVLRVLGQVVPGFVRAGQGDITLIGSLAGYRGLPASIGYGASKAALISLAETMRHDLKDSGVTVRVVNPGFIRTRLTDKNSFNMPQLMEPEEAARHVVAAMRSRRFRTDFPRPFSYAIKALHLLPDWLVYRGK